MNEKKRSMSARQFLDRLAKENLHKKEMTRLFGRGLTAEEVKDLRVNGDRQLQD